MARHLLVIGAGGFVGPWIVRSALAAGWTVTGLSRRPVASEGAGHEHRCADAAEMEAYAGELARAGAVVFAAAKIPSDHTDSRGLAECLRINAEIPSRLIEAVRADPKPVVYLSSAQGYARGVGPASEDSACFPVEHAPYYLGSKLLGDIVLEHARLRWGLPCATLRLASVYGPGCGRGMVRTFVERALSGSKLRLDNGGQHRTDLVYVADVAWTVMAVLQGGATGIFNIGSGQPTSALDAARLILGAAGRDESALEVLPAEPKQRPSGFRELSIARARRELAFEPTKPDVGLRTTVAAWVRGA